MNKEVLDIKDVLERVQDDRELLLELFDIFEEDFQEKRKNLSQHLAMGNFDSIRDLAHSMKGAAGNISAKALYASCSTIEQLAHDRGLDGIKSKMKDLDRQFIELQACIRDIKVEFKSST